MSGLSNDLDKSPDLTFYISSPDKVAPVVAAAAVVDIAAAVTAAAVLAVVVVASVAAAAAVVDIAAAAVVVASVAVAAASVRLHISHIPPLFMNISRRHPLEKKIPVSDCCFFDFLSERHRLKNFEPRKQMNTSVGDNSFKCLLQQPPPFGCGLEQALIKM